MTATNKVVVLFSGNGSTLQAILDQQKNYQYKTIAAISNRPDAYGLTRAENANIPALSLDHTVFKSREHFDQALIKEIDQFNPDLVVLAGYMRILSKVFVEHYQGRFINIHPSLLPRHKGLNTYQAALDAGDLQHGTSVHFVTEELDSGSIIAQASLTIGAHDTVETLEHRVKTMEQKLYPMAIDWITSGRLLFQNNHVLFDGKPLGFQGIAVTEDSLN